jgi:ABC-type multidrug transport system permease subunit
MRRSHFLLAYFFSRSLFLVAELVVLLAFGALVFGTVMRGGYLSYALLSFLGAAAFAAIGLVVGARVENSEVANGWINFAQMPMWVLCGAFFSYERFPEWLHGPIRALPLTALVDAMRGVMLDGATLASIGGEVAIVAAWGILSLLLAVRIFRWQ